MTAIKDVYRVEVPDDLGDTQERCEQAFRQCDNDPEVVWANPSYWEANPEEGTETIIVERQRADSVRYPAQTLTVY